jgi:hypothetical protein
MTSHSLDYGLGFPTRRWPWRVPVTAVGLAVGLFSLMTVPVRQVESRVDGVTGSMTWKTVWFFGVTSGPRKDASPLEARLVQVGVPWTPQWHTLHNTHRTLLGRATSYECGSAPAIYHLRPCLQEFVDASSEEQIRAFVHVMEWGTEDEKRAAVDAAGDTALAPPTGGSSRQP